MYYIPASPAEARELGLTDYFTGVPCRRGHFSERLASGASCVFCSKLKTEEYKASGSRSKTSAKYHQKRSKYKNKERYLTPLELKEIRQELRDGLYKVGLKQAAQTGFPYYTDGQVCHKNHRDLRNIKDRNCLKCAAEKPKPKITWASRKESARKKHTEATVRWQKRNKAKYRLQQNIFNAARKNHQRQATPVWLSESHRTEIAEFYRTRNILTETTGIPHQVDHIVPLRGKNVSGLHVPWNLQVIPAEENIKKSNKHVSNSA